MMTSTRPTPPHSRSSSGSSPKRLRLNLSLDLSDLPPLVTPAPPSNCLLVTNLNDPEIFAQPTLAKIRNLIENHTENTVYSFSPIKSMRRIIITFYTIEAATSIRTLLDGEYLFNSRIRIYFGEFWPIDEAEEKRLLKAPKSDKQFFISPPPSPPVGWQSREEGPPNKDVHAEDLAVALGRLNAQGASSAADLSGTSNTTKALATPPSSSTTTVANASDDESFSRTAKGSMAAALNARKRSGSVIVYDPQESGHSPDLPAIAVEDTTGSPDIIAADGMNVVTSTVMPRTELPPTDLQFGDSQ